MVGRSGQLVIRFTGDTRGLDAASGRAGRVMKNIGRLAAVGAAGLVAAGAAWAGQTAKAIAEVERIGAQTDAVIKSTGGAAERTRAQIDSLATTIEKMSGIEAETVAEGQNLLLTFTNIKGQNFDRATQTMTDMAVAMNGGSLAGLDMSSTAVQLGKALNDPVKGITALTKVGVTFTDEQKAQIKAMTDAGDVAGAQAVIMDELGKEFGGSAEAAGKTVEGTWAKIQNAFGNVSEEVLAGLLPAMQNIAAFLLDKGIPAFKRLTEWVKDNVVPAVKELYETFNANVLPVLQRFGAFIGNTVVPALKDFGGWITGSAVPALKDLAAWIVRNRDWLSAIAITLATGLIVWKAFLYTTNVLIPAIKALPGVINAAKGAVIGLFTTISAHPLAALIIIIAALVVGLVYFFTKTETGKRIVSAAWEWIQNAIKKVTDWWQNTALPVLKAGWEVIKAVFQSGRDRVIGFLQGAWDFIKKVWSYSPIGLIVTNWDAIWKALSGVWNNKIRPVFDAIKKFITKDIPDGFKSGVDTIKRIWDGLKAIAMAPVRFVVNTVWNDGLRKMINAIPGVSDIAPIRLGFAKGGAVPGVGNRDTVPAMLTPREHIWTAKEVEAAGGHKAMIAMRAAALAGTLNGDPTRPGFAEGGYLTDSDVARAKRWAQSQEGKPYKWASAGPLGYDCSGFMSAIVNVLRNKYTHARVGSTASFPWSGFRPGPGTFTIGSTPNYARSGIGHMAGTLAGLNVESRGGRGVIVGRGALGADSRGFSEMAHLGADGMDAMRNGGPDWLSAIRAILQAITRLPGQIRELIAKGGWITPLMGQMATQLWSNIARWMNDKIPNIWPLPDNPIPERFAHGGIVKHRPGGVRALIGEGGYDEAVVPLGGPYAPGGRMVLEIRSSGSGIDDVLVELLRRAIRVRGGDVAVVLGR